MTHFTSPFGEQFTATDYVQHLLFRCCFFPTIECCLVYSTGNTLWASSRKRGLFPSAINNTPYMYIAIFQAGSAPNKE